MLAERTFSFARQRGYEKILTYVRASNESALRFYKRFGFVEIGRAWRKVKIDRQYDDEIFLELFLEPMAAS